MTAQELIKQEILCRAAKGMPVLRYALGRRDTDEIDTAIAAWNGDEWVMVAGTAENPPNEWLSVGNLFIDGVPCTGHWAEYIPPFMEIYYA